MKENHDKLQDNPCHEVELTWRHERKQYILRLIDDLPVSEQLIILEELEDKLSK